MGHHIESIIQIVAETAGVDFVFQKLIGGGDDAGIDVDSCGSRRRARTPSPASTRSSFDLQLRTHAGDFVEKNGAAVRRLESAGFVVDGSGERSLDVAEQLAFQQTLGQGPAVDAHVGTIGAGAETVEAAGDEFLAGAGFADEQDAGRVGATAGSSDKSPHGGAFANDARQRCIQRALRWGIRRHCLKKVLPLIQG